MHFERSSRAPKHVTKQGGAWPTSAPQLAPSVRDDLLGKVQRLEDELGCD